MRTLMLLVFATAALGQTVTVEGKRIALGDKGKSTPAVAVTVMSLYEGKIGPDKVGIVTGYATSNLLHKYHRITIKITFWASVTTSGGTALGNAGSMQVVLTCPVPGRRTKWSGLLRHPSGRFADMPRGKACHTIEASWEKHVPDSVSSAHH